jgi:hypothetical protein
MNFWAGAIGTPSFAGGYVGFAISPQRNLWADGVVLRVAAVGGSYDYNGAIPFNNLHVTIIAGEAMVGYRIAVDSTKTRWLTGYIGANAESHDQLDPAATIRGSRGGLKGLVEYGGPIVPNLNLFALATYSTAFDSYFAMGRLQYGIARAVQFGPELSTSGSIAYSDVRAGAAVTFDTNFGSLSFAGGYLWNTRSTGISGKDGFYGNVHLTAVFR